MNKCLNCNKETTNPKFCSRSCSATFNNRLYPKRKPTKNCKNCGKLINNTSWYCTKCKKNKLKKNPLKYTQFNAKTKNKRIKSASTARKRQKVLFVEYKGGKCEICGYNKCISALEFHHIDPATKKFQVGQTYRRFELMKPELDKCMLLCANCHRELHDQLC